MTHPTRVPCPVCQRTISLKSDGTLRTHGYSQNPNYATGPGCFGSGKKPFCVCVFGSRNLNTPNTPVEISDQCPIHGGRLMECVECGKTLEFRYIEERNEKMREAQMCFTDLFWKELLERDQSGEYPAVVVPSWNHYVPGPDRNIPKGAKGFGGQKWVVKFHSGIEIETDNLWHQGKVPENWRGEGKFEINAELEAV